MNDLMRIGGRIDTYIFAAEDSRHKPAQDIRDDTDDALGSRR